MAKRQTPDPDQAAAIAHATRARLEPLDDALDKIDQATTPWDKANAAAAAAHQARDLLAEHEQRLQAFEAAARSA